MSRPIKSVLSFTAFLFALSCDEHLPAYVDPDDLFTGTLGGAYVFSQTENEVSVSISIRNRYDEELDGSTAIGGTIEIVAARNQTVRKTITLTPAMITFARSYDAQTGRLRLNPGEEIRFGTRWNLVDDEGTNLRSDFIILLEDTSCGLRCLGVPEEFILSATVKLYARTDPVVVGPTMFQLCYISAAIDAQTCPPLGTLMPCSERTPNLPRCPP